MDPDYKDDDDRDNWHLGDLLWVGRFSPAYPPDPNAFLAQDMLRRREDLGRQTSDVKRRINSLLTRYGVEPPVKDLYTSRGLNWLKDTVLGDDRDVMLRQYAEQLALLEAQKPSVRRNSPAGSGRFPEARHLVTIEGVGIYSALLLVFEIGPIERFGNLGKFRAFVGSALRVKQRGRKRASTASGRRATDESKPC